ncbi:MAG: PrsW family intramembrane metalloprotease [Actinomycetota bacterium]
MKGSRDPLDIRRLHWGTTTTLFQWRQPALWLYLAIMALGLFITFSEQVVFREISPPGWLLAWALVLLYAAPVFLLVYVLDLFEREPMSLVVAAFLWGAIAATAFAGVANQGWALVVARILGPDVASEWTAALTAPVVEETLKVLGIVLIYLIARGEMDDIMDGFVYGAMVGLGFAIVEDVFYFMAIFGGQPEGVFTGFFVRVVASGLYGHVLYTGVTGIGVAYFVSRRGQATLARRWLVLLGLFAAAVFAHFLWNSPLLDFFPAEPWSGADWLVVPFAAAVKGIPFLGFVAMLVYLARRRERRWLDAVVGNEVDHDGQALTEEEYEVLKDPRRRRRARREMRARAGPKAAALLKRLQRSQINLAMVRTRVASPNDPAMERQRAYCRSLRDALLAMPGAAPATRSG